MNFLKAHAMELGIAGAIAIVVFAAGFLTGCTKKTAAGVPTIGTMGGSVSAFDAYAYTSLVEAKAIIDQAKTEYAAGNLPESSKAVLNEAIQVYNLTDAFWQRYHSTGGTSTDAASLESEITADLTSLAGFIVQLRAQMAKPTTPKPPVVTPALPPASPAPKS